MEAPFSLAVWVGHNRNKGLGVFAFGDFRAEARQDHDPSLNHVLPIRVSGPVRFDLLGVWAQNGSAGINRRVDPGPLRLASERYRAFLSNAPSVVAGNWNCSVIRDRPGWRFSHAQQVSLLARIGLESVYHSFFFRETQRAESRPTLHWRVRRKDGPSYHVDDIFAPAAWIELLSSFELGDFESWCGEKLSDHVPLIADFAF